MKQFTRAVSLVLALLMVLGLSTTALAAQGYESVSLTGTPVGAGSATFIDKATFSVDMGDSFEGSLTIYKIADARYDEASGAVVVSWAKAPGDDTASLTDRKHWIAELSRKGYLLEKYPSPNELSKASAAAQKEALTNVAKYIDAENDNYPFGSTNKAAVKAALDADTQGTQIKFTNNSGTNGVFTFTDLPIGLYLAFDKDDHTPFTINAVPQKQDDGTWALASNQFHKKFTGASLVKTISQDQVGIGDVVEFTITAGIPNYPDSMEAGKKIFTIDDDMDTAFSFNKGTLEVVYVGADGSETALPQKNADGTAIYTPVISSDVTVYSCPTSSHQYFNIYEVKENGLYYYYFLKDDVMNLLWSGSKASNTLSYYGPVFKAYQTLTGDRISHGLSPLNMEKNLFNVNYNYEALKAWMTENGKSGGSVQIRYKATVTENVKINSDGNYNTAVLRYARDETGTPERIDDTVRAYSYGINIVKVNGDTLTAEGTASEMTEYLAGAVFSLYRQDSATVYKVELNDLGQAVSGEDMDAYNTALNTIMARNEVPYPLPNMVADTESGGGAKQEGYVLYGKIKDGIQSVASASGVQINGLGPGTYLLIENLAPSGYNLLTQGLRFSIQETPLGSTTNSMGDEEITTSEEYGKRGSLTGFSDGQKVYHANGYLDLLVSNFKGLTLPETGGIGTMMFTSFGVCLMAAAMLLLLKKRRMA